MSNKVTIDITHVYGPNDKVPGWDNNSNGGSNDDNYGSGTGDLTVGDLNAGSVGSNNESGIPGGTGGNGNGSGDGGTSGGTGEENEEDKDKNDPLKPDDNDEGTSNPFLDKMSKILDDAFQTLTPSTPNIMLETAKGTLNIKTKSNPIKNPIEIATKIATYFSITIVPKSYGVSGPVTMCSNNAMSIIPKLTNDLIALSKSGKSDNYESFVQTIYDNIANGAIVWNVMETIPGSPPVNVPYVVTVS